MDRRSLLGLSATTAIGLALSPGRGIAQSTKQGTAPSAPMSALSSYMSSAATRTLPPDAVEHAKQHLMDSLASIISGSELPPGQAAQRFIRAHGGKGGVTIAGTALTASPIDAALANGVMAHADETDDSHNGSHSHPGCAVVPATLAAAEELGADGARFLRALTLGYDVGPRVVMAMGGSEFSYESSLDTHSIAGTFGATAAASCIAALDPRQMRWALDYATQQSSGILVWRRDVDHIEKAFDFAGMPARNGITSALVVQSGWTGVDDVFSGPNNFFQAYAPKPQLDQLADKLGERYEITQTDIKKWTVGSPIQGPLDAMQLIRGKRAFEAGDVKHVTVRLAPAVAEVVDNRDIPDICLQHMVAIMLVDKTASFRAAHDPARMKDPAVMDQRAKVTLVRDEELAKLLPVRVAVVEIEFTDGSQLSERVSAVRGTPRNPMTRAEVIEKARDLIAPVLGRDKSEHLIAAVFDIENLGDIRALQPLLRRD